MNIFGSKIKTEYEYEYKIKTELFPHLWCTVTLSYPTSGTAPNM